MVSLSENYENFQKLFLDKSLLSFGSGFFLPRRFWENGESCLLCLCTRLNTPFNNKFLPILELLYFFMIVSYLFLLFFHRSRELLFKVWVG